MTKIAKSTDTARVASELRFVLGLGDPRKGGQLREELRCADQVINLGMFKLPLGPVVRWEIEVFVTEQLLVADLGQREPHLDIRGGAFRDHSLKCQELYRLGIRQGVNDANRRGHLRHGCLQPGQEDQGRCAGQCRNLAGAERRYRSGDRSLYHHRGRCCRSLHADA